MYNREKIDYLKEKLWNLCNYDKVKTYVISGNISPYETHTLNDHIS